MKAKYVMPTKAYRKFEQRINAYSEDLELCDILVSRFRRSVNSDQTISESLGSNADRHPTLARRRNSNQSRSICGAHLKTTLHVAFIKDLHEDFSQYLADILQVAAQKGIDAARFVGEVKLDLTARDILNTGSWDATVRLISESVFRKLENERSTKTLIQKITTRLGLQVHEPTLTSAMPYLDARHMLVHQDGKADVGYLRDYPGVALRNGKILVDYPFVSAARTGIKALAKHIDDLIIGADLVRRQDMDGQGNPREIAPA